MEKGINSSFIDVVNRQTGLYKSLEKVIKEEQAVLSAGDIKDIDGIVKKEEAAISEIKELEKEKQLIFTDMSAACGFSKPAGVKIAEILIKIGGDDAREIEKAVVALLNAARDVELVNRNNARLLRNFSRYTGAVRAFKEKIEKKPSNETYTVKGGLKNVKGAEKSGLDRTI